LGSKAGHRGEFVKAAKAVGFLRPWAKTLTGRDLLSRINTLAKELGPYPHAALKPPNRRRPGPGSRLRLWECACPVKVRVASDAFAATCDVCRRPFVRRGA